MKGIVVENLSKSYGHVKAVDNVSFEVDKGELLTLLGPSGCGKTTILRIIAGLIKPESGTVRILEKEVTHLPPWKRNCGFVFQSYALFPHMSVKENIAYGLRLRGLKKSEIEVKIGEVSRLVGIQDLLLRKPNQLSGGQQQRVALARALAIEPDVLLMDEPLANLDAKLRDKLRFELRDLQRESSTTTVYVTHDQEEAFVLSDRILVMHQGKSEQIGTPQEIFSQPRTIFVASFIGRNNLLFGKIVKKVNEEALVLCNGITLRGRLLRAASSADDVVAIVGAQDFVIASEEDNLEDTTDVIVGTVRTVVFSGAACTIILTTNAGDLRVELPCEEIKKRGVQVGGELRVAPRQVKVIPAES